VPKKERLFIPDLPQLIAFKGNNNEAVFRDQEDYQFFLSCLKKGIAQHAISLHAFSLLRSQIYLLLSAKDLDALSRLTQYLGRCYVGYFNQRHQRSGSLWEGRYRSCNIEASSYFLLCQKYVETRISQEDDQRRESLEQRASQLRPRTAEFHYAAPAVSGIGAGQPDPLRTLSPIHGAAIGRLAGVPD
jgi:REP element-mobilizing transposase RayT